MLLDYAQQSTTLRCMTQIDWAERFTAAIAREIERLRTRPTNKRSAQWLSDRTAELGHRVGRSRISDLETGRRKRMDITELIVLAEALEVPAVQLLFPALVTGQTEFLPGQTTMTWHALRHFTGETPFPGKTAMTTEPEYHLSLMRQLDYSGGRYIDLLNELDQARKTGDEANIERVETRIAELRAYERLLKQTLHKAGYTIDLDNTDV